MTSLDDSVRSLYEAYASEGSFKAMLERLAGMFDSHITGFRTEDVVERKATFLILGEPSLSDLHQLSSEYGRRWCGANLWMERSVDGYIRQGFEIGEAVVSDRELLRSDYYQSYLRPLGVRHGCGICLDRHGGSTFTLIGLNRTTRIGPISGPDIERIRALRPHLVNIFALHRRLQQISESATSLRSALNLVAAPLMFIDQEGHVRSANAAAETVLIENGGLRRDRLGMLRAASASDDAMLRAALRQVFKSHPVPAVRTLRLRASDRATHGYVLQLRLLPAGAPFEPSAVLVLLSVHRQEPAEPGMALRDILRTGCGLTKAEQEVVLAFRRFHTVPEIARHMGLSGSTIRTHLKHIFQKFGISRQSELTAIIERIATLA